MRYSRPIIALGFAAAVGLVWAQSSTSQQTSTSTSKNGQSSASASASASSNGSRSASSNGGGSGSGSAKSMPRPTHAIIYSKGDRWEDGKNLMEQPFIKEQVEYLRGFAKSGMLIWSGPWRDEPGGLTLIRVKNDQEAQMIMENDPAVKAGTLDAECKAWLIGIEGNFGAPPMLKDLPIALPPR